MAMIDSASVDIYYYTQTKNTQGILVKTFVFLKTLWADVQPKALTEVQAQAWGINQQTANTKWMGFDSDDSIHELYRAIVDGMTYEIRGLNVWPGHSECILIPVSGVAVQRFVISSDPVAISGVSYVWDNNAYWNNSGYWHD
jgi:head-tail adaptor